MGSFGNSARRFAACAESTINPKRLTKRPQNRERTPGSPQPQVKGQSMTASPIAFKHL